MRGAAKIRIDTSTPVILLGGRENAVAVARNLGRLGVPIIASGQDGCRSMRSKYCGRALPVPEGTPASEHWRRILLSDPAEGLEGALILAFCDESLAFVESRRDELATRYILEDFIPELRRAMLDKQATLELARKAGVPTPHFWPIADDGDVLKIREDIRFPVMVKPRDSYAFIHDFRKKLFIVEDSFAEMVEKVALARSRGHEVMVVEMIPGPDSLLSSYYTYRTPEGGFLYDYTKSIIRRWPVNRGGACFHQSQWLPETAEMGRRLFDGIGWQGIANVEFKRDARDGQLKIIEVNARFTAAHRLVTEAGAPLDLIVYCHLTGQNAPTFEAYAQDLRMWYPLHDIMAFRELRQLGQLGFRGWVKSIWAQKWVLPFFSLSDPGPMLDELGANLRRALTGRTRPPRKAG